MSPHLFSYSSAFALILACRASASVGSAFSFDNPSAATAIEFLFDDELLLLLADDVEACGTAEDRGSVD